jgi:hypothetical protein
MVMSKRLSTLQAPAFAVWTSVAGTGPIASEKFGMFIHTLMVFP